jgi:hypothetical protein
LVKVGGRAQIEDVEVVGTRDSVVLEYLVHGSLANVSFNGEQADRLKNEIQEWLRSAHPLMKVAED